MTEAWAESAQRLDLPAWLDQLAVADEITPELLAVAAATAGAGVPPRGWGGLLDRLAQGGVVQLQAGSPRALLTDETHDAMAAALRRRPDGADGVKAELLRTGISRGPSALAGQLARWARDLADWPALERVWVRFPPRQLYSSHLAQLAYGDLPEPVRAAFPVLGLAAGLTTAGDHDWPGAQVEARARALIHDGWTLHGRWRSHTGIDRLATAGTMRLFAESSMVGSASDPRLDTAWSTATAVEQLIAEHLRRGQPCSPSVLSFFHSTASSTAVLRRDWTEAKRHSLLAMTWSPQCDVSGFMAAITLAITSLMAGNPKECERALLFVDEHSGHDCPAAVWVEPVTRLPRAIRAVRLLRPPEPTTPPPQATNLVRQLNYLPLHLWVGSFIGVLWRQPEQALAEFDAGVRAAEDAGLLRGRWGPMILRARAELLLSLGEVNRAKRALLDLQHQDALLALVPTARARLLARDPDGAAAIADDGLYSLQVPLHERAHLHVVRAAARMLGGADEATITQLVAAACQVCQESESLLPFAMLPAALRADLLAHHQADHLAGTCLLNVACAEGAFDTLVPKGWWGHFPVSLTGREQVLLPLLARGLALSEIAALEYVSINTLRKQEAELRRKLNAHSRRELISRAAESGLLASDDEPRHTERQYG